MAVTNYFWDPIEDNVIKEYDDNGNTTARYTTEPTTTSLSDRLGNVGNRLLVVCEVWG